MAEKKKKMIIIGAGAAGLITAIYAADSYDVLLLEKNEKAGKKIYITGKGRCNLMNSCDKEEFMKNVVHNSKFLYSAINSFSPDDTYSFFESLGLEMKIERGNRVFPVSDKASDVTKSLTDELRRKKVKIIYNITVESLRISEDKVSGVETTRGFFPADVVHLQV